MYRRFSIHACDNLSLAIPNNKTLEHWQLKWNFKVNIKNLQALTLVGLTWENLVLDSLDELHLDANYVWRHLRTPNRLDRLIRSNLFHLVLEVELSLDGRWALVGGQDWDGVPGVGWGRGLTVAHDQEGVRALAVVNEVADLDNKTITSC